MGGCEHTFRGSFFSPPFFSNKREYCFPPPTIEGTSHEWFATTSFFFSPFSHVLKFYSSMNRLCPFPPPPRADFPREKHGAYLFPSRGMRLFPFPHGSRRVGGITFGFFFFFSLLPRIGNGKWLLSLPLSFGRAQKWAAPPRPFSCMPGVFSAGWATGLYAVVSPFGSIRSAFWHDEAIRAGGLFFHYFFNPFFPSPFDGTTINVVGALPFFSPFGLLGRRSGPMPRCGDFFFLFPFLPGQIRSPFLLGLLGGGPRFNPGGVRSWAFFFPFFFLPFRYVGRATPLCGAG